MNTSKLRMLAACSLLLIVFSACEGEEFALDRSAAGSGGQVSENDTGTGGGPGGGGTDGADGVAGGASGGTGVAGSSGADADAGGTGGDAQTGCPFGYADCDDDPANGCEVHTDADTSHCGSCESACSYEHANPSCVQGGCVLECHFGWEDCDGDVNNGCEQDIHGDPAHCGACDIECPGADGVTILCSGGVCAGACSFGAVDCNSVAHDGCEVETLNDLNNCGGCNRVCPDVHGYPKCIDGNCYVVCSGTWGDCDGDVFSGCETDLNTDPKNCGACGMVCSGAQGTPVCVNGVCSPG